MCRPRSLALVLATIAAAAFAGADARAAEVLILPQISAVVLDADTGQPAAGVTVEALFQSGKSKELRSLGSAVTDASGRAELPTLKVSDPKTLRLELSWDVPGLPRRTVAHEAKLKKGSKSPLGRMAKPDRGKSGYVLESKREGDCSNLLSVRSSEARIELSFRRPETYLACTDSGFKFGDLASIGARKINKGLNFFSMRDDIRMGQSFFNEMGKSPENPILNDREVTGYVQGLVDRIAAASDSPDLQFTVRVIDADVLNAFALPGGFIFVYRGLIEAAETEAELAGVLAHEVAHVTSRHGTEAMTSAIAKIVGAMIAGEIVADQMKGSSAEVKEVVKALILTGTEFWILGGSRKREAEADHLGAQYAWKAGYDPRGLATFFEKVSQARGHQQTRLEQFFSEHPNDDARIREVSRKVDYFLPPRPGLVVSSDEFLSVKRRLSGIAVVKATGEIAAQALFASLKAENERLLLTEVMRHFDEADTKEKPSAQESEDD
jgi:beta-barrel assembly-enhancing protease